MKTDSKLELKWFTIPDVYVDVNGAFTLAEEHSNKRIAYATRVNGLPFTIGRYGQDGVWIIYNPIYANATIDMVFGYYE